VTSVQRKSAASHATRRKTAPRIAKSKKLSSVQFVPAQITGPMPVKSNSSDEASIEVILRSGIILRITSACSPDALLMFVTALESRPC
jgi:hypothetical protein